jgi:hypothetical protein
VKLRLSEADRKVLAELVGEPEQPRVIRAHYMEPGWRFRYEGREYRCLRRRDEGGEDVVIGGQWTRTNCDMVLDVLDVTGGTGAKTELRIYTGSWVEWLKP